MFIFASVLFPSLRYLIQSPLLEGLSGFYGLGQFCRQSGLGERCAGRRLSGLGERGGLPELACGR